MGVCEIFTGNADKLRGTSMVSRYDCYLADPALTRGIRGNVDKWLAIHIPYEAMPYLDTTT